MFAIIYEFNKGNDRICNIFEFQSQCFEDLERNRNMIEKLKGTYTIVPVNVININGKLIEDTRNGKVFINFRK